MEEWILKALQLGMTGFAAVFLLLGFKLYWKLLSDTPKHENLELYKIKFREAKVYLAFSVLIMLIGISATIVIKDIHYQLKLKIDPTVFENGIELPTVLVSDKMMALNQATSGLFKLTIKNEEFIVVSFENLIRQYQGKITAFVKSGGGLEQVNKSRDGGFPNEI